MPNPDLFGKSEFHPHVAWPDVLAYLRVLSALAQGGFFGDLCIYPGIGVDALPALFIRLLGLNHWPHGSESILKALGPVLPQSTLAAMRENLPTNLSYQARVDVTRRSHLRAVLEPYTAVSPKSVLVKGLFRSSFCQEWDDDNERFYPVDAETATSRASDWLKEMTLWLSPGDTIVAFDPELVDHLARDRYLKQEAGIGSLRHNPPTYTVGTTQILQLPNAVLVFRRVADERHALPLSALSR